LIVTAYIYELNNLRVQIECVGVSKKTLEIKISKKILIQETEKYVAKNKVSIDIK